MTKIKHIFPLIFFLALIGQSFSSMASSDRYGTQKVVYHINYDDAKRQSSALRNIQNHINAVGADHLDVRVVMHGKGLTLIVKPDAVKHLPHVSAGNANQAIKQKIDNLKLQGVKFDVCANTVKSQGIDINNDLYDVNKDDIVPSGVAELSLLESEGFTYLRP